MDIKIEYIINLIAISKKAMASAKSGEGS